jgi:hypothetical protein
MTSVEFLNWHDLQLDQSKEFLIVIQILLRCEIYQIALLLQRFVV